MMDVGEAIATRLDEALRTNTQVTKPTLRALRKCLGPLESAIDRMCPIALAATKDGVTVASGPMGMQEGHDALVFIATSRSAAVLSFATRELGEAIEQAHAFWQAHSAKLGGVGDLWREVARSVERDDPKIAFMALCARIGQGNKDFVLKQCSDTRCNGMTPAILALAYTNNNRRLSAGITSVMSLMPSLELQLAQPQGAA
jgi:hypothetical protein